MRDRRLVPSGLLLSLFVGACAGNATPVRSGEVMAPAPAGVIPKNARLLPDGMMVDARLEQTLTTAMPEGFAFSTKITRKVTAADGAVAIPAGTVVRGVVTGVRPGSGAKPPVICLNLDFLELNGREYGIRSTVESIALNDSVLATTGATKANTAVARLLPLDSVTAIFPTKPGSLPTYGEAITLSRQKGTEPAELPAGSLLVIQLDSALAVPGR
jgi:hypothetical protein